MAGEVIPLHKLVLTPEAFGALLEYSHSLPTGTTIGKRWKAFRGGRWWVAEYVDVGSATEVGIRWYKPVIHVAGIPVEPRPWWLLADPDSVLRRLPPELLQ